MKLLAGPLIVFASAICENTNIAQLSVSMSLAPLLYMVPVISPAYLYLIIDLNRVIQNIFCSCKF